MFRGQLLDPKDEFVGVGYEKKIDLVITGQGLIQIIQKGRFAVVEVGLGKIPDPIIISLQIRKGIIPRAPFLERLVIVANGHGGTPLFSVGAGRAPTNPTRQYYGSKIGGAGQ